ncbi:MAG TPA: CBS domain-containing protein [Thermoanaerobaculia bacterium]|nr:CBS domain-containing protein [Thermoanaerobaculia bacterium]
MRPITAAHLMNPKVLAVRDDMTLRELAAFLIRNQITGAPVEDGGGRLVGVVSTVDIAEAVLAGQEEGGAADEAGGGGAAGEAARPGGGVAFFAQDWEEEPDEEDLAELRLAEDDLLVRDIMTPAVYAVAEDATVSEVASRMLDSHVHRLLVTREERPVGIITTSDLLGLLIDE